MEFSFSLNIKAPKEAVWAYYANIEKWYDWEEDLKNITLNGKFETGSCGTHNVFYARYRLNADNLRSLQTTVLPFADRRFHIRGY